MVSIDGVGATHDAQRGVEGAYLHSVETLSRLVAIRRKKRCLRVSVGMTVTPGNVREVELVALIA